MKADRRGWSPNILAFACHYCAFAAADLAGVMRLSYPTNVRVIRLPCTGKLLAVHIPQPKATEEGKKGQGSLWQESIYGFRYIFARPSLLGLQIVFLLGNFFANIAFTVFPAMILARTSNNALVFGSVETAGAVGGVVGGLLISAWGGPKRRIHGVLGGWAISSVLGGLVLGLGRALPAWMVGSFLGAFLVPLINSSNQAIWQANVAPDVQGRVFAHPPPDCLVRFPAGYGHRWPHG